MHRHRLGALTGALLSLAPVHAAAPDRATFLDRVVWTNAAGWFGGFSAIEVLGEGDRFLALSDRGMVVAGGLGYRDGRLEGPRKWRMHVLADADGQVFPFARRDSEGIAAAPDGSFYVSFEGTPGRIVHYAAPGSPGQPLPGPREFAGLQTNSGLEALAIDARGDLFAIPERSGRINRPFPVYRWDGSAWSVPFSIERTGDYLVVGADFGPDGRLYVLERDLTGIFGFRSRVRAFGPQGQAGATVLETATGQFGNLEGLSVWRDGTGAIRLTLIGDDNYSALLETELVEYRLD